MIICMTCIIQFRHFARMFSVHGIKMNAARRWRSERVLTDALSNYQHLQLTTYMTYFLYLQKCSSEGEDNKCVSNFNNLMGHTYSVVKIQVYIALF